MRLRAFARRPPVRRARARHSAACQRSSSRAASLAPTRRGPCRPPHRSRRSNRPSAIAAAIPGDRSDSGRARWQRGARVRSASTHRPHRDRYADAARHSTATLHPFHPATGSSARQPIGRERRMLGYFDHAADLRPQPLREITKIDIRADALARGDVELEPRRTAALGTITGCAVQGSDGACARSSSSAPTRVS